MTIKSNSESDDLDEEQKRTLLGLLNLIIPSSEELKMPGAADIDFLYFMRSENIIPGVREGLLSIIEESHHNHGQEFSALNFTEQTKIIENLRRRHFRFFSELTTQV